jgi:hypothetical protein
VPATSAEPRRPIGSDDAAAARVAVDQKVTRLPARGTGVADEYGRPSAATTPSAAAPTLRHAEAAMANQPLANQRLPRGAGAEAGAAATASAMEQPARRPAAGRGRFFPWLGLLCLLPVLLAGTAAYVAANYLDEVRAGRSEIMFHLPELAGDAANRFLATQPVVARSYPVVEPVARAEAMPTGDILDNLDITMAQGSTMMRIEYHDVDSARIVRVLESLTMGYLGLLRDIALIEGASHRLLSAPYLLEDPVGPRPLRAAAIGAVVGLAVAFASLVVLAQLRRPS